MIRRGPSYECRADLASRTFARAGEREAIVGDLLEEFDSRGTSARRARWLWGQTCRSIVTISIVVFASPTGAGSPEPP